MAPTESVAPAMEYEPGLLRVDQLRFDDANPRLPQRAERDQAAILAWLLKDNSFFGLMTSIGELGYFPGEPVLVSPYPDDPDATAIPSLEDPEREWTVVEGNRRLAAVRLLLNPELATVRPKTVVRIAKEATASTPERIPVIAFPKRDAILDYLGFRHVTGVKDWDPLEKARYLDQMRRRGVEGGAEPSLQELAKMIGSRAPYVGRLLTALYALERVSAEGFFKELGADEEEIPFSLLTTALNYKNLAGFIGLKDPEDLKAVEKLDGDNLRRLARWLFEEDKDGNTVLRESRNIRWLSQAVLRKEAIQAMDEGIDAVTAGQLALDADALFGSAVQESASHLRVANRQVGNVTRLARPDLDSLSEITERAANMRAELERRLASPLERAEETEPQVPQD
jgi:hypothetical protein